MITKNYKLYDPLKGIFNHSPFNIFDILMDEKYTSGSMSKGYKIVDDDEVVTLSLAVPGLSKKDLSISIDSGILEIKPKNGNEWYAEERRFSLGESLDPESIEAKLENGILSVKIRKETKKSRREIKIA